MKQHETGVETADLCREHGISAATFYALKQRFGGMDVSEAQRLKALEDEPEPEASAGGADPAWRSAEGGDLKKRLGLAGLRGDVAFVSEQFRLTASSGA